MLASSGLTLAGSNALNGTLLYTWYLLLVLLLQFPSPPREQNNTNTQSAELAGSCGKI